jgi:hypothetical protein
MSDSAQRRRGQAVALAPDSPWHGACVIFRVGSVEEAGMLRHYLWTAFGNLARHKGYAAINLFGLVTGLAACLILVLYVRHELDYDGWLPDADRVHQVQLTLDEPDAEPVRLQMAPYPAAARISRPTSA